MTKWIDNGELKGWRIPGSKDRRVGYEDLINFCNKNGIPTHYVTRPEHRILRIWLVDEVNTLYGKILNAIFNTMKMEFRMELVKADGLTFCLGVEQPDLLVINYDLQGRGEIVNLVKAVDDKVKILVLAHEEISQTAEALLKANDAEILRY